MRTLDWYFDFVSPFSYLQFHRLNELPDNIRVNFRPLLLAGILNHWDSKGPAEIPSKRRFTYRFIKWTADRQGIPFKLPPSHPFNPLRPLRLALAQGCDQESIRRIFEFIWAEGGDVNSIPGWRDLQARLGIDNGDQLIEAPEVKNRLRNNTLKACSAGVFGVPTSLIDGEIIWGFDATEMLLDYLSNPGLFRTDDMLEIDAIPISAERGVRSRPPGSQFDDGRSW